MKVKVKNDFIDKHNGKYRAVGSVIDVTEERYAEISKAGMFVEMVAEEQRETPDDSEQVQNSVEQSTEPASPIEVSPAATEPKKRTSTRGKKSETKND